MTMTEQEKKRATAAGVGLAVAAALLWACRRAGAQEPTLARLSGQVTDSESGNPVNGVDVNCNGYTGKTNSSGNYDILNIEPGTYVVTFTDPLGRYAPVTI